MKNYFGKNLKYLRIINNMTQVELSTKLNISHQTISHYERGERLCDIIMLCKIAQLFEISADDLLKKKLY